MLIIRNASALNVLAFETVMCWNRTKWCPKDVIKIIWKMITYIPKPTTKIIKQREVQIYIYITKELFDFINNSFTASNGLTLACGNRITKFSTVDKIFVMSTHIFRGGITILNSIGFEGIDEAFVNWQALQLAFNELEQKYYLETGITKKGNIQSVQCITVAISSIK